MEMINFWFLAGQKKKKKEKKIIQSYSKKTKQNKKLQPLGDVKGNRLVYVSRNCSELALGRKKTVEGCFCRNYTTRTMKIWLPLQFFHCCFLYGEWIVCPEVMNFGKGLLVLNPSAIHTSPKFTHVRGIVKTTSSQPAVLRSRLCTTWVWVFSVLKLT